MYHLSLKNWGLDSRNYTSKEHFIGWLLGVGIFLFAFVCFSLIDIVRLYDFYHRQTMFAHNPHLLLSLLYLMTVCSVLLWSNYYRVKTKAGNFYLIVTCVGIFFGTIFASLTDFVIQMVFAKIYANYFGATTTPYISSYWSALWSQYIVVFSLIVISLLIRWRMRVYKFNVQRDAQDTSNHLGSAKRATDKDILHHNLRSGTGGLIGKDNKGYLRIPKLTDRLILAYRGGGKTSSLLIPFILDYSHVNKLMTDIKGELAAVTARKAIERGREVYIIDPFNVLKTLGINIKTHAINPLSFATVDDVLAKDRYVSALAAALCSSGHAIRTETEAHFAENAQIILEGILDFYLDLHANNKQGATLVGLHEVVHHCFCKFSLDLIWT